MVAVLFLPGFGTNLGAPSRCRKRVSPQPLDRSDNTWRIMGLSK